LNLNKLFELQAKLDERIYKEHPPKEGEDRLAEKILALQVELGELAQNWRGFKYWSNDQEPRTTAKCEMCDGLGNDIYFTGSYDNGTLQECSEPCEYCDGTGDDDSKNPLLEEYVDCLHFLLSIGLELETTNIVIDSDYTGADTTETFIFAFETVIELANSIRDGNKSYIYQVYEELFNLFVSLGEKYLGFSWEQVEQAYLAKNKINHERQESGY
jgi:dimeric dUTPase (all-alpha-NTP-PPase superfamily)